MAFTMLNGGFSNDMSLEMKLIDVGKRLLHLPSSTSQLLNVLSQVEKILSELDQQRTHLNDMALRLIMDAITTKQLVTYPDMDVNISVAHCISEILRITAPNAFCNDQQLREFFELVVTTFEKLSYASGGRYSKKMTEVLEIFSKVRLPVLMLDLELHGLVVRLFKHFLTVADSNFYDVVSEMEIVMTMSIQESDVINLELVDLLVTSVRMDNQVSFPVCWKLGENVIKNCEAQLKPHLPDNGTRYDTPDETS